MRPGGQLRLGERLRLPEAGRVVLRTSPVAIERTGGHDAHDLMRNVVEQDRALQDRGVATELPLPGGVAEHDDRRRTSAIFLRREPPPEHRVNAEHGEVIGRDELSL